MTAMLHTWGQTLVRHVHLHCLVPGGALADDGTWHAAKRNALFPARALSRHVRGGFVSRLRAAFEAGRLPRISDRNEVDRVLNALMGKEWVVYSKPCLARAETVVDDLGRSTHRGEGRARCVRWPSLSDVRQGTPARERASCACAF